MESNRDDAERCQRLGAAALAGGEYARAVKFLGKAQRLFPTPQVAEQLAKAKELLQGGGGGEGAHSEGAGGEATGERSAGAAGPGLHHRHRSPAGEQGAAGSAPSASLEQVELVRRIRRCKDYYEILELSKTCTEEDIKKAYRKLSLKVHPDKNKATGAEEAFKAVSRAFQCLSDKRLRANYDVTGHEDPQQAVRQRPRARHHSGHPFFQDDSFDPNDIFNAFFGMQGMNPNARVFRAHFGQQRPQHPAGGQQHPGGRSMGPSLLGLLQLLPLLAIFLYALMPAADPHYKLQRTDPYLLERRTSGMGVTYFVKSEEFERLFPATSRPRRKLEYSIEAEYRDHVETRCYYERVQQAQSYRWGDGQKTREMKMPNCDELRRLQRAW